VKLFALAVVLVPLAAAAEPVDVVEPDPPTTFAQPPPEDDPPPPPQSAPIAEVLWLHPPTPRSDAEAPPSHGKLGFRIGFGRLHAFDRHLETVSLGLMIEHPVFERTRVFAEYEWLWFGDKAPMSPATEGLPGSGHRAHVGIRAELLGTTVRDAVHFYVDAELGGGLGVVADDLSGVQVLPHVFAGVRAGYDFLWGGKHAHSSHVWEAELLARAIRVDHGTGALFGIGMLWGD